MVAISVHRLLERVSGWMLSSSPSMLSLHCALSICSSGFPLLASPFYGLLLAKCRITENRLMIEAMNSTTTNFSITNRTSSASRMDMSMFGMSLFLSLLMSSSVLADPSPTPSSLPAPVLKTANAQKGAGTLKSVETFPFGKATIYKIDVIVDGAVTEELQIADTGKLIRVDTLK
jgi:hypothetical protein